MLSGEVLDQTGQSRELEAAPVARLPAGILVQLPPVNSQSHLAAQHFATLVTAVLHSSEVKR